MQHAKVPQDRIGALIGEGSSTLQEIESRAKVRLDVGSENGNAAIDNVGDPMLGMVAPGVVQAVGRDFVPEGAVILLGDDMTIFELIDIDRHTRNKNDIRRQKGRLIDENGRIRELMEELTRADIVIYGTTLGIVGQPEEVKVVHRAVEMVLDGVPHGAMYSFLERKHNGLTQGFNVRQNNRDATADESTPTRHDIRPHHLFTTLALELARPPGESYR